jgi:hypothetical protein
MFIYLCVCVCVCGGITMSGCGSFGHARGRGLQVRSALFAFVFVTQCFIHVTCVAPCPSVCLYVCVFLGVCGDITVAGRGSLGTREGTGRQVGQSVSQSDR